MKRLMFALILLLILVAAVDATGRHALSQEAPVETTQLSGTDVLLARSASGIVVWKFDGTEWQQLPNGPSWSDAGGWNRPEYYSTIQTGDIDGDGRAELLARGAGGIQAWEYEEGGWQQLPSGPPWSDAGGWNSPEYYSTIHTGDIDNDGQDELLARSASGIEVWEFDGSEWQELPAGPPWSDAAGWNAPEYYSTIQSENIYLHLGGREELIARSASGIEVWEFDGSEWREINANAGPPWSDAAGWNAPEHYSTIQTGDIDSGGRPDLLARGPNNIEAWRFSGLYWEQLDAGPPWSDAAGWDAPEYYSTIQVIHVYGETSPALVARNTNHLEAWAMTWLSLEWYQLPNGPSLSDAAGWNRPEYYSTIQSGDIDGDSREELLARSASGIQVWEFNGSAWPQLPDGPPWSDAAGWNRPEYYSTIQTADIEGLPTIYLPVILAP